MRLARRPGMPIHGADGVGFRYVVTHDGVPHSLHSSHVDADDARASCAKWRAVHRIEWAEVYGATTRTVTAPASVRGATCTVTSPGAKVRSTDAQPAASQTSARMAGTTSPRASTQYARAGSAVKEHSPPRVSVGVMTQPKAGSFAASGSSTAAPHPSNPPTHTLSSKYRMRGA